MEDSCPATPLVLAGGDSKSPLQIALSSPESNGSKSPSRDSPDSRCVICLGRLRNKSFTDSCLHQFCFQCLLQWSKVKPECPLCKQPFKSIIHNVRSNLDYDQYHIEHGEPRYVLSDLMHSYNFDLIPIDRRFRYRSTMTREYFRELAESFLAHTRRLPEDSYQIPPMTPFDSSSAQNIRRSSRLHFNPLQQRSRQRGTSDFRRNVYAQDLWVQDLVDISGRYRECTPQFYRENPAQIHRIIPWLNREVNVLLSDCESHAAYVLSRIVSILTQHSIRSREFRELVQPYFGERTDHFIHELYTFAHSVYDIAGFDQHAVYGTNPNYATEVQEISSSNDDSDIEVLETFEKKEKNSKKFSKQGFKKILLKRLGNEGSKSDEPIPGPSGIASNSTSDSIEICESDTDDIKVLDYVKPEPEVVTLSSGEESRFSSAFDFNTSEAQEIKRAKKRKSRCDYSSSDEKVKKISRNRSGKGKCKSNGVGLKGKQKKNYIRVKNTRSSSSSSSSSTSSSCSSSSSSISSRSRTSKNSNRSCSSRSSSRSCSSGSCHSNSSNRSSGTCFQNKSRKHKNIRSRSISVASSTSSEYKSSKSKKKKSKSSHKKYKKKINSKSSKKLSSENKIQKSSNCSNLETDKISKEKKRKVKSCVIVPNGKSRDSSPPRSFSSSSSRDSDKKKNRGRSQSLASYWSIVSSPATGEKSQRSRESSFERKLSKSKRCRDSSSEETSGKRVKDSESSSERSKGTESSSSLRHSRSLSEQSKCSKQKSLSGSAKSVYINSSSESLCEEFFTASGLASASTSSSTSNKYSQQSKLNTVSSSFDSD